MKGEKPEEKRRVKKHGRAEELGCPVRERLVS